MCVSLSIDNTRKIIEKYTQQGQLIGYKVVHGGNGVAWRSVERGGVIKPGILQARDNGKLINKSFPYGEARPTPDGCEKYRIAGIHVFFSKRKAREYYPASCYKRSKIVRVICPIDLLLRADDDQAAFSAVYISPEHFKEDLES